MALPALKSESKQPPDSDRGVKVASPTRLPLELDGEVCIPDWVVDLAAFRRWANSRQFPKRGKFSYLGGSLWVDLTMEELFTHNRVKTTITSILAVVVEGEDLGCFFADRAYVSSPAAQLSTEPDGVFVSYEAIEDSRVRLVKGKKGVTWSWKEPRTWSWKWSATLRSAKTPYICPRCTGRLVLWNTGWLMCGAIHLGLPSTAAAGAATWQLAPRRVGCGLQSSAGPSS
jgi:hypothetical protein